MRPKSGVVSTVWMYRTVIEVTLGEALEVLIDHRGKTPKKLGGDWARSGHRVVSALNVKGGRILDESPRFVDDALYRRWMPVSLAAGDVLLTSEAPLGEVAYLRESVDWCLGQRVFGLRGKAGTLEGRYLYYLLRQGSVREEILSRATGSTVAGIRQAELVKARLVLPPIQEQRRIAATLGALDDKIDSNRRIEGLCLDLAMNCYAAAADQGATRLPLSAAGTWLSGSTPSTDQGAYWGGDLPWISAASLKDFFIWSSDRRLTDAGREQARVVTSGTVLLVVRGMSLKTELRLGVAQTDVAFGQDCKAIIPDGIGAATLACALLTYREALLELVDEAGHGTGRLQTDRLERFEIALPRNPRVDDELQSLLDRGSVAARESRTLASLRDTLLPELLSGRIRVPEAREAIAEGSGT